MDSGRDQGGKIKLCALHLYALRRRCDKVEGYGYRIEPGDVSPVRHNLFEREGTIRRVQLELFKRNKREMVRWSGGMEFLRHRQHMDQG